MQNKYNIINYVENLIKQDIGDNCQEKNIKLYRDGNSLFICLNDKDFFVLEINSIDKIINGYSTFLKEFGLAMPEIKITHIWDNLKSSWISKIEYDSNNKIALLYINDITKQYYDMPAIRKEYEIWPIELCEIEDWVNAESIGVYFNENIRKQKSASRRYTI